MGDIEPRWHIGDVEMNIELNRSHATHKRGILTASSQHVRRQAASRENMGATNVNPPLAVGTGLLAQIIDRKICMTHEGNRGQCLGLGLKITNLIRVMLRKLNIPHLRWRSKLYIQIIVNRVIEIGPLLQHDFCPFYQASETKTNWKCLSHKRVPKLDTFLTKQLIPACAKLIMLL